MDFYAVLQNFLNLFFSRRMCFENILLQYPINMNSDVPNVLDNVYDINGPDHQNESEKSLETTSAGP